MKNSRVVGLVVVSFTLGAGAMWAQQQSASGRVPQFENDQLRVWKTTVAPHAPLALHRHDHGRALVALDDGQLKIKDKNGKVLETYNLKRGTAIWLGADPPGQMHTDANDGDKPFEVIVVQLQQDTVKR